MATAGAANRDYGLGRLPQFDERSRAYPVRTLVADKQPRSYTWAVGTWLDQGADGACVGFSIGHDLAARPVRQIDVTEQYAREVLYWGAQQHDEWPGGAYPGAPEFYEGSSVLGGMKAATELGHFTGYRWAFNLDELVLAIGYHGPAVIGLNWHNDMFDPDADGRLHPTGGIAGGHAILAYKVATKRPDIAGREDGQVWLHNSWGIDWGMLGRGWVTFTDMAALLADDGEAAVPVGRQLVDLTEPW